MSFDEFGMTQQGIVAVSEQKTGSGTPARPRRESLPKEQVTVELDVDVVAIFKATGRGWQTRMNAALRDWLGPPWAA